MLSHPALLYCLTACTQPFEASPPPAPSGPLQAAPVVMDSACARITFMFSGSSGISVAFPNRDACTDGVVVIPGGTATRSGSGSKNANIPIRLLNRTGYTIESPPTVVLAPGGRMILEPAGGSPNKLTPQNHDSVRAGSWIWQVGGAGTVAAGDSTPVETLVVRLDSPASSAQMTFTVEAQLLSAGGWPLFTTTAPVLDPSKTVAVPGTDVVYFRTSGTLLFKEGVSDQAKQQFFAENGLTVRGVTTSGLFFVSFPDPGESLAALEAFVESIGSKPEVLTFGPDILSGIRDVYGALSLLSRERPGAPICGYPVTSGGSYAAPHVVLEKNGPLQPATDSIKVPGAFDGYLGLITVAPGGRIISAYAQRDSLSNGNQAVIQFNHLGQRLGAQSGVWGGRHYLERYIVDHRQMGFGSSIWQELTLRQPNGDFVAQIPQLKLPDGTVIGTFNPWWIEVSPDARFVAFSAGQGTYVQRFADNSTTYIGEPGSVSWSKDGTRLLVFESDGQTMDFRTYQVDATAHGGFTPGQTASSSSSRVFLYDVSMFAGDDAVFYSGESDSMGGSWVVARPVTALAVNGTEGAVPARGFRNIGNVATVNP